jgi:hypothetical protein
MIFFKILFSCPLPGGRCSSSKTTCKKASCQKTSCPSKTKEKKEVSDSSKKNLKKSPIFFRGT